MSGKVIDVSGVELMLPSYEIAEEEKRIWILYLYPGRWFEKRERIILATEIATPDERLWKNWNTFVEVVGIPIINYVLSQFFIEMYRLGITNYNDMIPYWEEFAHAPDWMEFFNAVVQARNKRKWWENVKPKLEELKQKMWDDLKAKGKYIGIIHFAFPEHKETIEEMEKELWDIVNVNAIKKIQELCGEKWKDCWKTILSFFNEHNRRLEQHPISI